MMERKIRDMFKQEWEIPEEVKAKKREAYRRIGVGADTAGVWEGAGAVRSRAGAGDAGEWAGVDAAGARENRKCQRHTGRRYLKAASFFAAVLFIGATATAAAAGFDFGMLKKLFGNDAGLVQQSSSNPEAPVGKVETDRLKIEVEGISGTEEITYVMLHITRTDGGTFRKGARYTFGDDYMEREGKDWEKEGYSGGASFGQGFVVTENEGTEELRMTFVYGHKSIVNGAEDSRLGDTYRLHLGDLKELPQDTGQESEGTVVAEGDVWLSFVLDYGKAVTAKKETDVEISFPVSGEKKKYAPAGTLKEVTVTPYYVKYVTEHEGEEADDEPDTWPQIYVEMDDGSRAGFMTEADYADYATPDNQDASLRGGFGVGFYDDAKNIYRSEMIEGFPKLIDVEHVSAVYFGETRVEIK